MVIKKLTKIIYTETGHRLTNYNGRCAHIHGHSYKWEVTVKGEPVNNGMVMDFKKLKQVLLETVDTLDHAFVMHKEDPIYQRLGSESTKNMFLSTDEQTPRLHFVDFNPTVENLVAWQAEKIMYMLDIHSGFIGQLIELDSITCWETSSSYFKWENVC